MGSPIPLPMSAQASSAMVRMAVRAIPSSPQLAVSFGLPIGGIVQPLASPPDGSVVPVINFGTAGVIRCRRCRTYVNPFIIFSDGGRRWQCNMCRLVNEVTPEYFSAVNGETGLRADISSRPELTHGTVEFVAPQEYMVRPPQPPAYVFVIDATAHALSCGFTADVVRGLQSSLDRLPSDGRTMVGFVVFTSTVSCFAFRGEARAAEQLVLADPEDVFSPLPDDLLVNYRECHDAIMDFVEKLPAVCRSMGEMSPDAALGPALQLAASLLQPYGGKMCIFCSLMPTIGSGKLEAREDMRLYGTDKENSLFEPQTNGKFYRDLATECTKDQICVDLFLAPSLYMDVASLGQLAQYTGGDIRFYSGYLSSTHGEALQYDIRRVLSREIALESVVRIRCSNGLKAADFNGHFLLRSNDLMAIPNSDADKSIGFSLQYTQTSITWPVVFVQTALLYTSTSGERRIRVHTLALPVTSSLIDIYSAADPACCAALLARNAAVDLLTAKSSLASTRGYLIQEKVMQCLRTYRAIASPSGTSGGSQLILPSSLQVLPLLCVALLKNPAFTAGTDVRADERLAMLHLIETKSVTEILPFILPRLFVVPPTESSITSVPLSNSYVDPEKCYVLHDSLRHIVACGATATLDERAASALATSLRRQCPSGLPLLVSIRIGQGSVYEKLFRRALVEDRVTTAMGYAEFLAAVHNEPHGGPLA